MAYVSKIQAPDGTIHEFEFESEPSEDTVKDLVTTVNSEWGSWGQESFDTLPSAFARGATQSAASLVEGVGDISGSDTLSQTGRDLKDSAAATFPVDPAREDEFATKAAGVIGQGLEQAAELLVPISKFGRASRVVQGAGYSSAAIKGADAGEDVARQFGVDDDPVKRAALMAGYGLAEVGSELIGGLGPEKAIGELLGGQLSEAGYRAVGKGILTEGIEEGASQVGQNSLTRSIITEDEAKAAGQDLPDYFDDVLESIALGGIAGGALSAPRLLGTAQAADQAATVADVTSPQADTPEGLTAAVKATEATLEGRMTEIVDPRGPFIQEDQAPEDLTGQELLPPVAEPEPTQSNEENQRQRQEGLLTEAPPLAETVSGAEATITSDEPNISTEEPETGIPPVAEVPLRVLPGESVPLDGQAEVQGVAVGDGVGIEPVSEIAPLPTEGPRVVTGAEIIANAKPGDSIVLGNGDSVTVETLTPEGTAVLSSPKYGQQVIATDQSIPVAQEFLRPGKTGASTSVLAQGSAISEPVAKRISKDLSLAMKRIGFPGNVDIRFVGENDVISEEDTRASRTLKGIKGVRVDGPSKSIIYLNRDLLTADTPVHELMHGYVPAVKQQRPDLYDEGVKLLESNQDYLRAVRSLYPEGMSQDQLYEEAMVSALGIEGAKLWESTSKNKEWVKAFRRFVARLKLWLDGKLRSLGMKSDMTLGEWAKLRNLEIFAGKKVLPETQGSMGNPTDVQGRTEESVEPTIRKSRTVEKESVDPAPQKPTGLGKNVRANPKAPAELTQAFEGITYQSERGSDAAEQAEGIFQEVQKDTKGWAGHVAKLDELMRTAGSGEVLNLTPGAYFGRIMQSLREVMENPRSSLAQKDSAKARMRELAEMQASQAATFGQLVKGFDVGWKLAYPELQVESAERTVTFKNEEDAKGHVRELAAILDEAFQTDKEAVAALLAKPEEAVAALQKVVGRQIRGEDTADAGAAEAEANSTVAEQEDAADEADKLDWLEQGFREVQDAYRADTMVVLRELRMLAEYARYDSGAKSSLSPDFLAQLEGDTAGIASMTPAQRAEGKKKAQANLAAALARMTKRTAAKPKLKKDMTPEERQEYAATQIFDTLSRMVSKKKKKGRKSNDQLIVSAIAKSLMQKAGVNVPISNEAEERAVMLGLLLTNQEDAYAALEQAKTKLESDPATKDLITSEQLNAFGQLVIGREFDKDPEAGAAFGPRQVAQVLRAELETANADMRKIVMDASLANRTAYTIEKQLRDPSRGLETRLGKEGLDRLVSVVGSSYQKTLAERAEAERKKDGKQALSYLDKKPARIIDYLIQRKGLDLKGIEADMNDFARQDKLTKAVADLAAKLNLSPEQTKLFVKPVVAEGVKYLDAKRKREVKARLEKKIQTAGNRKPKATELQKLTQLIELGALDEDSFSTVLLGEQGAKKFTPEFKARLTERLRTANDPATPLAEANNYRRLYSQEIEAAKGTSIMRLIGETTMAHIFGGLNTQKINFAFGGMKTWMDNASWAKATAKASGLSGAEGRAAQSAILKSATRGYAQWSREEAKYILKTGFSNATEDPALHFSNAMLEVMKGNPDTEIRTTQNGKPLPASVQSIIRKAITFHPYVRRAMVASDIFHRATAWEVLKASQAVRALKESGQTFKTQQDWLNAIDELNYGPGGMKAALKDATDQAQREVNAGTLDEIRKGVRVQELMDGRMAEALGMSGPERLAALREEAKRWTLGSITPGVLGGFTELLLSANRIIPGAGLFLPAVRVPVNAMWQSLDWSPYGFLRAKIANSSQRRTESVSAYLFDREGKRYPKPASLVSDERVIDLRNKAFVGTALLGAAWAAMAAGLDDDDEKAAFYITGRGPEDPTKAKDWRARGFQPYSVRIAGQDFNFRESPLYAVFAPIGAWSDAHRYGKLDDTAQERISAAAAASVRSVGDQAVLKNLIETLGFYAGGENRQGAPGDQLVKSLSRIGASVIAPNVGREVNQILYGPPNTKEQSWAGNLLANVPFVAGAFRQPAINALGDEIHEQRGGVLGETAGMLTYRISAKPVDDPQLHAVARLGMNKLSTTRRTKTGEEVMDDYDLVRKWAKASGKRIREYLTPAKIAELEAARKKDQAKAEEKFDAIVKDIRTEELDRLLK